MASKTDKAGISDTLAVAVNGDPVDAGLAREDFDQSHLEDCKGPDPAHWDDQTTRVAPDFDPGDPDQVRHDDPLFVQVIAEDGTWTVERASSTEVSHVKGPGPEWDPA